MSDPDVLRRVRDRLRDHDVLLLDTLMLPDDAERPRRKYLE
jgi:hypothetical protein